MHHVISGTKLEPVTHKSFGVPLIRLLGDLFRQTNKTTVSDKSVIVAPRPNAMNTFIAAPVQQFAGSLVELDKPFYYVIAPVLQIKKGTVVDLLN